MTALLGGLISLVTHHGIAFLRDRIIGNRSDDAAVQEASYRNTDWEHFTVVVIVLAIMLWTIATKQDANVQNLCQGMAAASVAWFTGRRSLR